jgi:glycosyltransferase involved in cell wall biosynthesis
VAACSVIVCTRYRPDLLARCLASLGDQQQIDHEVIVVDNTPGDPETEKVAADWGVRYVIEARVGASRARNAGVNVAMGESIAFLDDDCVAEPGWLLKHSETLSDSSLSASTGRILPLPGHEDSGYEAAHGLDLGGEEFVVDRGDPLWFERANFAGLGFGGNMAVKRSVFDAGASFRESIGPGTELHWGEDVYLLFTLIRMGHRVAYAPAAVVRHGDARVSPEMERRLTALERRHSAAYLTLLLVEERGYVRRTADYLLRLVRRKRPPWRPEVRGASPATRVKMLVAALHGPLIYLRNRLASR